MTRASVNAWTVLRLPDVENTNAAGEIYPAAQLDEKQALRYGMRTTVRIWNVVLLART